MKDAKAYYLVRITDWVLGAKTISRAGGSFIIVLDEAIDGYDKGMYWQEEEWRTFEDLHRPTDGCLRVAEKYDVIEISREEAIKYKKRIKKYNKLNDLFDE